MKSLNKETALKAVRPERIIQFGEGNFLRCFVDWIISNMNEKTDFNSSVVVVQPIEKGMIDMLNSQDCLYHVNLQGLEKGEVINSYRLIDVISRCLNPYTEYQSYLSLAEQPEMRFVISNTTEAGITFDPSCRLEDTPPSSYPASLRKQSTSISNCGALAKNSRPGSNRPAAFTPHSLTVSYPDFRERPSTKSRNTSVMTTT